MLRHSNSDAADFDIGETSLCCAADTIGAIPAASNSNPCSTETCFTQALDAIIIVAFVSVNGATSACAIAT